MIYAAFWEVIMCVNFLCATKIYITVPVFNIALRVLLAKINWAKGFSRCFLSGSDRFGDECGKINN